MHYHQLLSLVVFTGTSVAKVKIIGGKINWYEITFNSKILPPAKMHSADDSFHSMVCAFVGMFFFFSNHLVYSLKYICGMIFPHFIAFSTNVLNSEVEAIKECCTYKTVGLGLSIEGSSIL